MQSCPPPDCDYPHSLMVSICLCHALGAAVLDSLKCAQIPNAHPIGVTAVSWAPAAPAGSLIAAKGPGQPESRFASSGADNTVKVRAVLIVGWTLGHCLTQLVLSDHLFFGHSPVSDRLLDRAGLEICSESWRVAAGWRNPCRPHRLGEGCSMGAKLGTSQECHSISRSRWEGPHLDREQRHAWTVDTNPPA